MLDVVTWFVFELCGVLTFGLKVATPEGVVRDSSDGDDGNGNVIDDSSSDEDENGLDPLEQARQAAKRHCGWVPSTCNGVEVRCTYRCGHDATCATFSGVCSNIQIFPPKQPKIDNNVTNTRTYFYIYISFLRR